MKSSREPVFPRVLHLLLKRLGIPKAGLHAFRHSRVTMLRKNGTPEDLQKQAIRAVKFQSLARRRVLKRLRSVAWSEA
jgi:hypothetical protein